MSKLLLIFAHPAPHHSRVNVRMARAVQTLPDVTFHDLYDAYPQLDIDVDREQQLLSEHKIVVFQHPLYWYSTPAILKEWMDLVLQHGWAFGQGGTALQGQIWINAISSGGSSSAYQRDGAVGHTVRELLLPIELTAKLCGVRYLPPFLVQGTHRLAPDEIDSAVVGYVQAIEALRDDVLESAHATNLDRLNDHPALTTPQNPGS